MNFRVFRDYNPDAYFSGSHNIDASNQPLYETLHTILLKNSVLAQTALIHSHAEREPIHSLHYTFKKKGKSDYQIRIQNENTFKIAFSLEASKSEFSNLCLEAAEKFDQSFFSHREGLGMYLANYGLESKVNIDCTNEVDAYVYAINWSQNGLYVIFPENAVFPIFSITQPVPNIYCIQCAYEIRFSFTQTEAAPSESSALAIGLDTAIFFRRNNAIETTLQILYRLHRMQDNTHTIVYIPRKIFDHLVQHSLIREQKGNFMLSFVQAIAYTK